MYILLLLLLSNCIYAQTNFSLKKEGNSLLLLSYPEDYTVKADTMSSWFRLNRNQESIDYDFRITDIVGKQCSIFLYSSLSPVFDSLVHLKHDREHELIIYDNMKKIFKPSFRFKGKIISYKISPLQQHPDGYYYVDVFETTYQSNYVRYVTNMKRVFVIDGIEHRISVYTKGYPYNKTVRSSRKAVCCVFEELVNNLVVELE